MNNLSDMMKGAVLLASLVLVGFAVDALHPASLLTPGGIEARLQAGVAIEWWFLGAGVLFTAAGLPRQVVAFLGGYAFGITTGVLLAVLATLGGCVISFYYARWLGRSLVGERFPHRVRQLDRLVAAHPLRMTLLLRLLPVGSNLITNLSAGVSSVPAHAFLFGSALGYLPQTLVVALVGSGVTVDPSLRIGTGAVLFLVSGLIGLSLYRRYRRTLSGGDDVLAPQTDTP